MLTKEITQTNRYIHASAPWDLARQEDPESRSKLAEIIYYGAESLRIVGILLQPFMPTKSAELLEVLGVPEKNRTVPFAQIGADYDYGVPMRPPGRDKYDGLFPPLAVED